MRFVRSFASSFTWRFLYMCLPRPRCESPVQHANAKAHIISRPFWNFSSCFSSSWLLNSCTEYNLWSAVVAVCLCARVCLWWDDAMPFQSDAITAVVMYRHHHVSHATFYDRSEEFTLQLSFSLPSSAYCFFLHHRRGYGQYLPNGNYNARIYTHDWKYLCKWTA